MDFTRINMTPYYDLPETDHSDVWFKRIPHAIVGDQYGNELFILLVHDAIRNFDKRSFSFVDTLTQDFIRNHWFSNPIGIYDGSTLLYKIDFTAKRKITGDSIQMKGAIFIQPDDYSIHKLEYSASYFRIQKKRTRRFSILRLNMGMSQQLIPGCVLNTYLSIIHSLYLIRVTIISLKLRK